MNAHKADDQRISSNQKECLDEPITRPYTSPRLLSYGRVRELTAGGSGSVTEAAAMNKSKNNRT